MPRASRPEDFCCTVCSKVLARDGNIKCRHCGNITLATAKFVTEMKPDTWVAAVLWKPDGTRASTIVIRKEVRWNVEVSPGVPPAQLEQLVFHVYDNCSPEHIVPWSGCSVRSPNEPFLDLDEALGIAAECVAKAIFSGDWVHLKDVQEVSTAQ